MKVGIITFHNAINYGGVLQVYALQEILKKYDVDAKVINYQNKSIQKSNKLNRQVNVYKGTKLRYLKTVFIKLRHLSTKKQWERKFKNFESFKKERLDLTSEVILRHNDIRNLDFEAYISGSDQVWNPNITGGLDPAYFCDFETNAIKISYAASCGSIKTIEGHNKEFLNLISSLDYISTRENELANFINSNMNNEAVQTLDPTLLLSKTDYKKVARKPNIKEPYLLIYKLQENKELYKTAKKIAADKNLKIYEIGFRPYIAEKGVNYLQSSGPEEFLGLFENAEFIITNSFHGTVFSLLNEKDFFTIPHKSVGQRMIDLLNKLGLEDRIIINSEKLDGFSSNIIDYKKVNNILNEEKERSLTFLKSSLNI